MLTQLGLMDSFFNFLIFIFSRIFFSYATHCNEKSLKIKKYIKIRIVFRRNRLAGVLYIRPNRSKRTSCQVFNSLSMAVAAI